jgi:hypothetical protein
MFSYILVRISRSGRYLDCAEPVFSDRWFNFLDTDLEEDDRQAEPEPEPPRKKPRKNPVSRITLIVHLLFITIISQ